MSESIDLHGLSPLNIVGGARPFSRTDEMAKEIVTPWGGNGMGEIIYLGAGQRPSNA
jgi:hypothetical protein